MLDKDTDELINILNLLESADVESIKLGILLFFTSNTYNKLTLEINSEFYISLKNDYENSIVPTADLLINIIEQLLLNISYEI